MKVAYLSNLYQGTGYSQAALNYVLALDAAGVDVVPRNLWLEVTSVEDKKHRREQSPQRVRELEEGGDTNHCDAIIQHTLPHLADSELKLVPRILMFAWETSHFLGSCWPQCCDKFDYFITFCDASKDAFVRSGIESNKIFVVPHALDLDWPQNPALKTVIDPAKCSYLYVGEWSERKNTENLVKVYLSSFDKSDNVKLILKTFVNGMGLAQSGQSILERIKQIKDGLRLKDYPEINVITDRLDGVKLGSLYKSCTYGVSATCGEAFGYPIFECMSFSKPVIYSNSHAFRQYIQEKCGWPVDVGDDMVFGCNAPIDGLYTGKETWLRPSNGSLQHAFIKSYMEWDNNKDKYKAKCGASSSCTSQFSYKTIGNSLKKALEYEVNAG